VSAIVPCAITLDKPVWIDNPASRDQGIRQVTMTSTDASPSTSIQMPEAGTIDMKLEVVTLPVSDVDRAKRFYQSLGWRLDADIAAGDAFRAVQLTPTHSQCSIAFGKGLTTAEPGSAQRLLLAVSDIDAARADLISRGVGVSDVFHLAGGVFRAATRKAAPTRPMPRSATRAQVRRFMRLSGTR
jgi:catechol 2,3-dioxygenase-like lactoylglutathione lyase family enzyme